MQRTLALAAIGLTAALAAPAQAQQVRFIGAIVISGSSGTCTDYDPTGDAALARFRPAGIGSNGPDSSFSIFYRSGSYGYMLPGASWNSSSVSV